MRYAAWTSAFAAIFVMGCAQSRVAIRTTSVETAPVVAGYGELAASEMTEAHFAAAESVKRETVRSQHAGWKATADLQHPDDGRESTSVVAVAYEKPLAAVAEAERNSHSPSTTLPSLEELALASNPTLLAVQAKVDAANGRWLQVGLKPNPVASISIQEIGNDDSAGQYGALIGQEFVTADKLELNRNSAAWRVKQVEQELAAQRLRVLTDVRRGFYSMLVAQERLVVANELLDIAEQSVEKATELIKFQEPATVLTQAEIEAELAAVLVDNFQIQRKAQWHRLAAVVGQPDMPLQNVDGELKGNAPKVVWDQALDRLRRESPEIASAMAEVEQSRWKLQRADVESTPNVTLQAGVFYDDSSSDPFATLQMSMPLPLNDWNQGGIAEAQANVIAAEQSVERVELSLQQRLAAVYQQYEQARKQAARYETTILQKARKNLDLNRQSYDSGQSSYLAVLTAQRSYSQARLAWLNALDQLWSATVQMDGLLLSGSLK
ncbi:MAG: cobalt-zinc-cadmium efflux system outer membrane protein [Porticoccaceae bacterium]|jgi:cobalt-zinc-cadmium efflux system outer membrane protein